MVRAGSASTKAPQPRVQKTYGNYPDWWNELEPKEKLPPLPEPTRAEEQSETRPRTAPARKEHPGGDRSAQAKRNGKPTRKKRPASARAVQQDRLGKGAWNAAIRVPKAQQAAPEPPAPGPSSARRLGRRRRHRKAGERGERRLPKYLRKVQSKIGSRIKEDRKAASTRLQARTDSMRDIARHGVEDDVSIRLPEPEQPESGHAGGANCAQPRRPPMRFGKPSAPEPMMYFPKSKAQKHSPRAGRLVRAAVEPQRPPMPTERASTTILTHLREWTPDKDPHRSTCLREDFPFLYGHTAAAATGDEDACSHAGNTIMDIADALLSSDVIQAFSEGPLADDLSEDGTGESANALSALCSRLKALDADDASPKHRSEVHTLVPKLQGFEELPQGDAVPLTQSPSQLMGLDYLAAEL